MTTALQDRKLAIAFAQLDIDDDGRIERDDLLNLGARILVGFGEAPTSQKGAALIESFDHLWQALVAELDRDRDGQISPEEFNTGMNLAFIEGDRFDDAFRPASEAVARLADSDGDEYVGLEEFRALQTAFGTAAGDIEAAFERLDADHDHRLTVDELVDATRGFYTSADPEALGNWLFGAVER